jgi:hypothetical protein
MFERVLCISLLSSVFLGCQQSNTAVMNCGGSRPGFTAVASGAVNDFFEATSPQSVRIKPDVKVEAGTKDRESTLTFLAMDGKKADYTCSCGAGCNGSCAVILSKTPPFATCTGDCQAPNACCGGCRLWANN